MMYTCTKEITKYVEGRIKRILTVTEVTAMIIQLYPVALKMSK